VHPGTRLKILQRARAVNKRFVTLVPATFEIRHNQRKPGALHAANRTAGIPIGLPHVGSHILVLRINLSGQCGNGDWPMRTTRSLTAATIKNPVHQLDDSVAEKLAGYSLEDVERALILRTLNDLNGNRTQAATVLGISVRCLRDKIRQFRELGIAIPESNHPAV
jgi:DNA-binding protein Fis